jgi:predicted anti-sigma-YlaC factor YlaD
MILALPVLLLGRDAGAPVHIAREVGSFDFALAVGFLFVGWRPVRAYGMLPLVAALVACLAVTTTVDLARGTATLLGESAHLLDLMGLASVWELARADGPPRPLGQRGRGRLRPIS